MHSAFCLLAATLSAAPSYAWKQAEHSLALVHGDAVVWQFNFDPAVGKPCFHPLTVAGSPPLTDFRPADHPWHRALWFSWKTINGVLYWEEDKVTGKSPGETRLEGTQVERLPNMSARIEQALSYLKPGGPIVLREQRTLRVAPPAADGGYAIDWTATFTAGDADVLLGRTAILGEPQGVAHGGYAGLSLRLSPALNTWQFRDAAGPVQERWKNARWMAFAGPVGDRQAAIVVFDHPQNVRHPTPWYLIPNMPYFSPAVLYQGNYTLPAGQSFTLRYQIRLQPTTVDAATVEQQWKAWTEGGSRD